MNGNSFQSLAIRAVRQANGNAEDAKLLMRKWLEEDPAVMAEAIESLIAQGIANAVALAVWRLSEKKSGASQPSSLIYEGRLAIAQKKIMEIELHNGKTFKDADKNDLLNDAHAQQTKAGKLIHFAKFEEAVAAKLKRGQAVKDVFTETQLRALDKAMSKTV